MADLLVKALNSVMENNAGNQAYGVDDDHDLFALLRFWIIEIYDRMCISIVVIVIVVENIFEFVCHCGT